MKKVIQKIRITAIIIGCSIIILGIIYHGLNFVNNVTEFMNQSELERFPYIWIASALQGLASSFSSSTLIILLALIINPNKVVPLLDKKEVTNVEKAIQKIRIAAIIIGCSIIILGVTFRCTDFVNNMNQIKYQPFRAIWITGTLWGLAYSFSSGTIIILLALIINPNKVVPLLHKKEVANVEEEI